MISHPLPGQVSRIDLKGYLPTRNINVPVSTLPKRNPRETDTNVHIVRRVSLTLVTRSSMKGFTRMRNHTNVHTVRRVSIHQVTRPVMKGFILKRNHTNVSTVRKNSLIQITGPAMKGFTQKRNHTNVHTVTRVSLFPVTRPHMKGFTPRRNHTSVHCDKCFTQSGHKTSHEIRIHTKEKPYHM